MTIHPSYRADIDGLRAIAVLSVLLYHTFPNMLPGGFVGVDVFFVISGYLITTIIFTSLDKGEFSLIEFYARRIRRIFPALIVVLIASLVFAWFFLLPDEFSRLGLHATAGAGFVSNILLWSESGYFDLDATRKPFLHLWSLGIEEQFYLLWPALVMLTWNAKLPRFLMILILGILSFLIGLVLLAYSETAAFYLPIGRFWELLVGSGLVLMVKRGNGFRFSGSDLRVSIALNTMSIIGVGALFASLLIIDSSYHFPGLTAMFPVLGAALLVLSGSDSLVNKYLLSNRLLTFFGSISFALYLWHWPLISFHEIVKNSLHFDAKVAIILVTILLAYLTTRFIETPLRFGRALRQKTQGLALAMILIAIAGLVINFQKGFEQRFDTQMMQLTRDLQGGVTLPSPSTRWCDKFSLSFCTHQGKSPSMVLIGDSHARALYFGMSIWAQNRGQSLAIVGQGACPPYLFDSPKGQCLVSMSSAITTILRDPDIKTVFLTYQMSRYLNPTKASEVFNIEQNSLSLKGINTIGLRNAISTLKTADKRVVILEDVPELPFDIRSCLPESNRSSAWDFGSCSFDKAEFDSRRESSHSILIDAVSSVGDIQVLTLADALCDSSKCYGANKDMLFYTDTDHLSIRGSGYVVESNSLKLNGVLQ